LIRASLVVAIATLSVPIVTALATARPAETQPAVPAPGVGVVSPYSTGMAASIALGQTSFTTRAGGLSATNLSGPGQIAFDAAGDLWVADSSNNRVLEFPAPLHTGEVASLVLGQPNFDSSSGTTTATGMDSPLGLAFSPSGDLWVADLLSCRVTEFVPPFHDGMAASVVIGQSSLTTSTCGHTASTNDGPEQLAFDPAGDLFVADWLNNRLLEFTPPLTTGMSASAVLGQSTLTGDGAGTTAVNLSCDLSVAATASMVWVGSSPCGNQRVLGFPAPITTGEAATVVLGQASFTSSGATGDNVTDNPNGLGVNSAGDLFVNDFELARVLEFTPPFSNFQAPSRVLGQSNASGMAAGTTATNLSGPRSVAVAPDGSLWVSDLDNNRVLGYVPSVFSVAFQESGLPATSPWTVSVDGTAHFGATAALDVPLINGTHEWTVGPAPPDYHLTSASSGAVLVNNTTATVPVTFAQNSTSSLPLVEGLAIGGAVGVVVGAGVGVLVGRRRKAGSSGASAGSGPGGAGAGGGATPPSGSPPASPPAASGGPPPGASP
jgi:hypothetical protein